MPDDRSLQRLSTQFDAIVRLPFGCVGVQTRDGCVEQISFLPGDAPCKPATNALAQCAVEQLITYCNDSSAAIDLPLSVHGTEFQRQVWREIAAIPVGTTRTYGEIASRLNGEARAVGQACGDNRLPLAIPCHRVVAATGIGGFAHHRAASDERRAVPSSSRAPAGGGRGAAGGERDRYERIKRWLLLHEAGTELRLV
ncbi:MAG: methylated-DNA--[protein]-cysteine S-methyltransferase [Burkholderiaceae bacterium]